MSNEAAPARSFSEDIAFGASLTYATGGNTATVERAAQVERVKSCTFKAYGATAVVAQPVAGSESGQTFKYRLYQQGGSVAAELAELANGATVTANASALSVDYEGT